MGSLTKSTFCGFEITFSRNPDADGVIARAVHSNGTVFTCNHSKSVPGALHNIRQAIRSSEFHPRHSLSRAWPKPLMKLYKRALLFLDNQSAVHDRYWAAGIVRALDKSFPECGETHTTSTKIPGTVGSSCQVSPQATRSLREQDPRSTIKHHSRKEKRRRKRGPQQLAFKLTHEERPDCKGSHDESNQVPFRRFQRTGPIEAGQRVVLVCTIWSTLNRMPIESGTWGEISEVGSNIRVEWQLPHYRTPIWDCFRPDEYVDYFEEG